jgi:hypothetical protein
VSGPNDREVTNTWKKIGELEASFPLPFFPCFIENLRELVHESCGYALPQIKRHFAFHQSLFGIGGSLYNIQPKCHAFSKSVYALCSPIKLKSVFDQILGAEWQS